MQFLNVQFRNIAFQINNTPMCVKVQVVYTPVFTYLSIRVVYIAHSLQGRFSQVCINSNSKYMKLRVYDTHIYTASKVKHHLNIFQEKTVKLSKHEFILVTCLKRNKVVIISSKF